MGRSNESENMRKNDWEKDLENDIVKKEKDYNLDTIYKHTHDELSLQQSKRDQIISIYLALFSFLIPFSLSLDSVEFWMKGVKIFSLNIFFFL